MQTLLLVEMLAFHQKHYLSSISHLSYYPYFLESLLTLPHTDLYLTDIIFFHQEVDYRKS